MTMLNRTYGTHKTLPGTYMFGYFYIFTDHVWSYLLWSPVVVKIGPNTVGKKRET